MRRQKTDKLSKMITDKPDNEQLYTTDMTDLESDESAEQRSKKKKDKD